ncbi:amidase [Mesorhizobium sp. M5C.F.Cr.IN.023.01.1.1]|uniref:amidase n=1 Tax=Mesorhizobium sp. M5C.F.Cr.IN.023.01.1.1 TaxID=2496768 RepID=UPI000FCAB12D|nr:amidase [Mesorhizobium sp. M5C.F.Cr.IN.023.01.1.1]RUV68591.1 amidase [Mesorhizobium sp. M5C.F.Cr.IN.023.01.1.1]
MRLEEYVAYDATGLGVLVKAGHVSPAELARLAREACARVNLKINAVIEFYDDAETVAGVDGGVFQGVPFLRKDIGASERGRLQERGSRLFIGYRPATESYFFQRARGGGLRTLGRTATPELGVASVTESVLNGITRNPWNLELSPGGSSGGAAAAVAAGIVPIAHGGDGGGSIRIPATFTNLVGLNPSRGRISGGPNGQDASFGLSRNFVLCRSVRDMAAALDVFSATFPGDPFAIRQADRPYVEELKRSTQKLRIGVALTKWGDWNIDRDVLRAVSRLAEILKSMGHDVWEMVPPCSAADYVEVLLGLKFIDVPGLETAAATLGRTIGPDTLEPVNLAAYLAGKDRPLSDAGKMFELIRKLRVDIAEATATFDLLLTPVMPMVSMPHGLYSPSNDSYSVRSWVEMDAATCMYLIAFNITGQPSVSLPVFQSEQGLPIGVHIVSRFGDEATLVRISRDLEEALPWASRRPPVFAGNPE